MSIQNKITFAIKFCVLVVAVISFNCVSPDSTNMQTDVIALSTKINLPGVNGRIDHIAYDEINHLAFIAALGNNTVEVVNISTQKIIHSIKGLHAPQGIIYIPSLKRLVVANDEGGEVIFFDATNYNILAAVNLKNDADNVRYDADKNLVYVGYGNGGIAIIDANTMKKVGAILLDGHPESFQISKKQNRLYINVPDADEIQVADIATKKVIAIWKNTNASSNFSMALDAENNRLFIGCRHPATLRIIDIRSEKDIQSISCSGDADDVFYNSSNGLVFVSAGHGYIDVFKNNGTQLTHINHIETSSDARTSLLLSSEKKLLLAVPAISGNAAALWVYNLRI
jgi:DNA-binding beta-propeller fold protein YncE